MRMRLYSFLKAVLFAQLLFSLTISDAAIIDDDRWVHYTIEDGLPSNTVYSVMADSLGYIWLASSQGVVKFDGYDFTIYGSSKGAPSLDAIAISKQSNGSLWFYFIGIPPAYLGKDSLHIFNPNNVFKGKFISRIVQLSKNEFWIGTKNHGLHHLLLDSVFTYGTKEGLINDSSYPLLLKQSNEILIMSKNYFGKWKGNGFDLNQIPDSVIITKVSYTKPKNSSIGPLGLNTQSIMCLSDKPSIIVTNRELCGNCTISTIFTPPDSNFLFVATDDGGYKVSLDTPGMVIDTFLSGYSLGTIYYDDKSGLWATSLKDGLFYLSKNNILASPNPIHQEKKSPTHSISLVNDQLFIGIGTAFSIIKDSVVLEAKLKNVQSNTEIVKVVSLGSRFIVGSNMGIYILDSLNAIELITEEHKVKNRTDLTIESTSYRKHRIQIGAVKDMATSNDSIAYAAASSGLVRIVPKNGEVHLTYFIRRLANSVSSDKRGRNYYIDIEGAWYVEDTSNEVHELLLPNNVVPTSVRAADNKVIFGTKESGLLILDRNKFTTLTLEDGLWSNNINKISVSEETLYIHTSKGVNILKLEDEEYTISKLALKDVFRGDDILQIVGVEKDAVIRTVRGAYRIYNTPEKGEPFDLLKVNEVYVNDSVHNSPFPLTLSYDENSVQFNYNARSYSSNGNINYQYQLIGYDNRPTLTKDRQAIYRRLPPGDYKFKLTAWDINDTEITKPIELGITITPPFWETWWFRVAVMTAILLIGYIIARYRILQVQKRSAQEVAITNLRLSALHAQINPHFLSNALSSIQYYVVNNESDKAARYLSKFSRLMRLILNSSLQEWTYLEDEIELNEIYLELEKTRIPTLNYKIDDTEIDILEDAQIPGMILQPFIENAIIHAIGPNEGGNININVKKLSETMLQIFIDDDGKGYEKGDKEDKTSRRAHGSSIVDEKLRIIGELENKDVRISIEKISPKTGGTRVTLTLPYRIEE